MEENAVTTSGILETIKQWGMTTGIKIVIALLIMLITFRIITVISRRIEKRLEKSGKFDRTLVHTICLYTNTAHILSFPNPCSDCLFLSGKNL